MAANLNHFLGSFADDAAVNSYISGNSWTAEEGWIYYNSTATELRWWDGSAWVGPGGSATDVNAVHVNASAEINGLSSKGTPVGADELIIEDSATSYSKKKLLVSNIPVATHATTHQSGGADSIKLDDLATPDDNTDLNASTSAHGLLSKLPGGTTNFLREDGAWSAPPGGTDPNAIHDNVNAEINALASKGAPVGADEILIEDSATSYSKKKLLVSNIPVATHATTHQSGGADAIKLDDLATPDDNTDLDATTGLHGLLPKLGGGTTNFLRADGTWAAPGGSSGDIRTAAIVVGNSVAGDTADDCDYLDVGDGAQLVTALAASSGKDVYIRPGTYNLGAGSATAPFTIPAGVRVRGAGRGLTTIQTKASGDQGAWLINAGSVLEDVDVDVALPTGACSGQTSVVLLNAANAEAHRVQVNFLGSYTSTESGYSVLKGVFGAVTNSVEDAKLIDCTCGTKTAPCPSFVALGEALADALRAVYIPSSTSDLNVVDVRGLVSHGADIGIDFAAKARALDYTIYDAYRYGIHAHDADSVSLTQGEINMVADQGDEVGILLDTITDVDITAARIIASTGSAGTKAVALVDADDNSVGGVRVSSGWGTGLDLDSDSSDNVAIRNHFSNATTAVSDAGSGNEVAHYK